MKKIFLFLSLFIVLTLACNFTAPVPSPSPAPLPTEPMIPATSAANETPTALQPSFDGVEVFYGPLRLILPQGLASGIHGSQFSRVEGPDVAPWEVAPGHTRLNLDGYLLQGKFHEPQILVYLAQDYAEMFPPAFENIHRLNNILYDPGAPVSSDQLPTVPFFNAGQMFASNVRVLSFQNGQGVRFLTEYAQNSAPVNNFDLFYHFQGVSADGAHYIIAILPVTVPVLAETSDGGAVLPPGGIPYPDITDPNADWAGYYTAVTSLLDGTPPEAFAPTITQLDALIQSIRVTP